MSTTVILEGAAALAATAELRGGFVRALERVHARHGPLVAVRYPSRRKRYGQVVLVADPAVARGVLMDPAGFTDPGTYPRLGPPGCAHRRLREGIILARGEEHACQRRRVLPPLSPAAVERLRPRMTAICADEVARWPADARVDLVPLIKRLLRRLSLELLFGETDLAAGLEVAGSLEPHADLSLSLQAILLPFDLPGLDFRRLMTQAARTEAALMDWVAARRARPGGDDMLSVLLAAHRGDGAADLSDGEAAAQLWTLYGASFHTLSAALSWLLVLLAQHPAEAEAVRVGFADPDRPPGEAPPAALAAIQEAMRLITPVPFQMRQAADEGHLPSTDLALRPRDTVVLSALVMNRNPAAFPPDPDRFRPGRWTGAEAPAVTEALVFSGGPRFCPGRTFALAALAAALEAVWTRWRLRLEPGQRLDYKTAITLSPTRALVRLGPPEAPFNASRIGGRALRLASGLDGEAVANPGRRAPRPPAVGPLSGAWARPQPTPRPIAPG